MANYLVMMGHCNRRGELISSQSIFFVPATSEEEATQIVWSEYGNDCSYIDRVIRFEKDEIAYYNA